VFAKAMTVFFRGCLWSTVWDECSFLHEYG